MWAVISSEMIKYQLSRTRFDQISDHKHDIYLYGKLSTELTNGMVSTKKVCRSDQSMLFTHS